MRQNLAQVIFTNIIKTFYLRQDLAQAGTIFVA